MLGVSVLCADTDEQAQWLAGSGLLAFVRLRTGRPGRFPTPEEAADVPVHARRSSRSPATAWPARSSAARRRCTPACRRSSSAPAVDELMIVTMTYGHKDRVRSYELIAAEVAADPLDVPT